MVSFVAAVNKACSLSSSHLALLMEIVRSNELSNISRLHRHDTTRKIILCVKVKNEKIRRRSSSGSCSMFFDNLRMDYCRGASKGLNKSSDEILIKNADPCCERLVLHIQVYLDLMWNCDLLETNLMKYEWINYKPF